jgi:hypothetical protein
MKTNCPGGPVEREVTPHARPLADVLRAEAAGQDLHEGPHGVHVCAMRQDRTLYELGSVSEALMHQDPQAARAAIERIKFAQGTHMVKDIDPRQWLLCRMQEYGVRYYLLILDYIDHYATDDTAEDWERMAQEIKATLSWQDDLDKKEAS